MLDRLVDLINEAKDKYPTIPSVNCCKPTFAYYLANRLLAGGAILPPCKVGDTVYRISKRYGEWCVLPRTVCSIRYSLDSRGNIAWYLFTTIEDRIGKTVFLTREEAEQAIKGESNGQT